MLVGFYLSMPNVGSWNGKWSGESTFYARTKSFVGKKRIERAKDILTKGFFYHAWDDGWAAEITVKEIDAVEARRINTKSKGFCNYDWMIENIINHLSTRKPETEENYGLGKLESC